MRIKIGIVWFRHDLRLRDNQALSEASEQCDVVLPIYVFDERLYFDKTTHGMRQISIHRAKFLIESVDNLRKSLADKNVELIVRIGKAEDIIYEIANQIKSTWVFCNRERAPEEELIQDSLESRLWQIGQELRYSRGKLLYHTGDLPFPVKHVPDTYAAFYREVGKIVQVRKPLPVPDKLLPYMGNVISEQIPTLQELGFNDDEINKLQASEFIGGENEGLRRLETFIKENFKVNASNGFHKNRTDVLTTELNPYLSAGCISPKSFYDALSHFMGNKYHSNRASCIIHGLMRRDFLKLLEKKYKDDFFDKKGMRRVELHELTDDMEKFEIWKSAKTGIPIVDAFMRQLNNTGFISFEGRRVLSQFLIEELNVNWVLGAEYFQSMLIDYNPCSNWGNWNIVAGVAFDAKEDRYCSFITKSKKLDPSGNYIRKWIPELSIINDGFIHEPIKLTKKELQKYNIELGKDYPLPIVDMTSWV